MLLASGAPAGIISGGVVVVPLVPAAGTAVVPPAPAAVLGGIVGEPALPAWPTTAGLLLPAVAGGATSAEPAHIQASNAAPLAAQPCTPGLPSLHVQVCTSPGKQSCGL